METKYFFIKTEHPQIVRYSEGETSVYSVKKVGQKTNLGMTVYFLVTSRILKKFQKARHSLILKNCNTTIDIAHFVVKSTCRVTKKSTFYRASFLPAELV